MIVTALTALDDWLVTPQGLDVSAMLCERLTQARQTLQPLLYGSDLLQIGAGSHHPWLSSLPYQRQWLVSPQSSVVTQRPMQHVQSSIQQLPFKEESMACVVAPFTFELVETIDGLLDEVDRILKPMGALMLMMVKSWSLWGLALKTGWGGCFGGNRAHLVSLYHMQRALSHRGYSVAYVEAFYHVPPVQSAFLLKRLEIFNELGKMVTLCPAGFYCLVAQKYVPHHLQSLSVQMRGRWQRDVMPVFQPAGYSK